jgi:hypothetical protein
MTPQQVVGLGAKIFAIWLFLITLTYVQSSVLAMIDPKFQPINSALSFSYCVLAIIHLAIAAILWFFPMSVAHRLIPITKYENTLTVPSSFEIVRIGCCLLGIWFLLKSGTTLMDSLSHAFLLSGNGPLVEGLLGDLKVKIAASGIEIIVALILIFGASKVAMRALRPDSRLSEIEY